MAGPDGGRYARVIYAQREDRRMPYRYPRLLYFVMSIVTAPRVMTVSNRCRAAHGRRWAPVGGSAERCPAGRAAGALRSGGRDQGSGAVGGVRTPYCIRTGLAGVEPKEVCGTRVPACCRGLEWWRSRPTTLVRCA